MILPKRSKYRKSHRSRLRGRTFNRNKVSFGDYGLQSIQSSWITSRQLESSRRVLIRYVRRNGKLWIRIFPDNPVTRRPIETRMGSGKGNLEYWIAVVRSDVIIFEMCGVSEIVTRQAMRIISSKLPIKTRVIKTFIH